MTAPTGIEVESEARVRAMFKACPTFISWIGDNINPDSRIHEQEVIESLDPLAPRSIVRPLVLIENPQFEYMADGLVEYSTAGSITALVESQYLGGAINEADARAMFTIFKATVGQIHRELMDLRLNPLGTSPFVYFDSISVAMPPTRTLLENRGPDNDFFAIQWRFSLMNGGGA